MKTNQLHFCGINALELSDKAFENGQLKSKLTREVLIARHSEINDKLRERSEKEKKIILHNRINERAAMLAKFNTRLIATKVGLTINCLLYNMRPESQVENLLIAK